MDNQDAGTTEVLYCVLDGTRASLLLASDCSTVLGLFVSLACYCLIDRAIIETLLSTIL